MVREGSACISPANESKLRDPLIILETIKKEIADYPELYRAANSRLVSFLISVSTMKAENNALLVQPYKINARKKLKKIIPELIGGNYSLRLKYLAGWATLSPATYPVVHTVYSFIKGNNRKYVVK